MKVLQVTTHVNIGGIGNYVLTLSKALKAQGAEVVVASAGGDLTVALAECGIPHRALDIRTKFEFAPKVLRSAFTIARIAREEKVDIIHAHSRVSQVASALASWMTKVPYVTTCHGYFKKRLRGVIDTWGAKVIAISEAVKTHLENDLGVEGRRIALVYSGVECDRFSRDYPEAERALLRKDLGLEGGPVVGTIGRLSSVKGQEYLVRALKEVIARKPGVRGLIVGSGEEEAPLKKLAGDLGISGSIRFVGSCPDTHAYLSAMDVFVFPSIKEGLGIALLEALASGRAAVASRVGGIGDIITNGSDGLLVPVGDAAAISEAVISLLGDEGRRKKMGERGRALVKERFRLDVMAGNVLNVYREVAGTS